jgi:cytochrome c oxidase cbb3-type subunit 3
MRIVGIALLSLCSVAVHGQTEIDLADGKATFRSNCAFCHGITGGGGRGPVLSSGRFLHGSTADDIKNVIRSGVPGTTMPAFEFERDELDHLVAYVRAWSAPSAKAASTAPIVGDAAKGRQVYEGSGCAGCHRIGSEGSVFGPELTRIGAGRSAEYIRESLVNP